MLFHYKDSRGIITRRELSNFKDDGTYVRGFDLTTGGVKTFRKNRILSTFTDPDETDYLKIPVASAENTKRTRAQTSHPDYTFEICFTGFSKEQRPVLESRARDANLKVCKSVTVNLDFLCIGENAGPKKMAQAEDQGVTLMTADEFDALVNDGVLPEAYQPRDLFVLKAAKKNAKAVIDPAAYFADWVFKPKSVLWSAANVVKNNNQQYTLDPDAQDVREGDVFYFADENEGVQVIFAGDGFEVMHFKRKPEWWAQGYLITHDQLIDWLKLGQCPPKHCQISKNQSKSNIAQHQLYTTW